MSPARRLRDPRGVLELFAATFVAAVVTAAVLSRTPGVFEQTIREKYAPAPSAQRLAADLAAGDYEGPLSTGRDELYRAWMLGSAEGAAFARAFAAREPSWLAARVERTLVAGSREQARRALALVVAGGLSAADPALANAARRAEALHDLAFRDELLAARARLTP